MADVHEGAVCSSEVPLEDQGDLEIPFKGWSKEDLDECVSRLDLEKVTQLISTMMEEAVVVTDDSYDSDEHLDRPKERWAPLGAAVSSPPPSCSGEGGYYEEDQMRLLEEEQDRLNNSLFSLTTHFAQVQFRLKQIVEAPTEHKEDLLKELEEFAHRGIPDVESVSLSVAKHREENDDVDHEEILTEQRKKQQELILQLKSQLEDLETYAYQTGHSVLPTNQVVEKQKVIIDQLRNKLHMEIDDLGKLTAEDLRKVVDNAIGQIVNPAKVKEKLVEQLKTQITDLERFISFLQGEATSPGPLGSRCTCPVHGPMGKETGKHGERLSESEKDSTTKKLHQTTLSIMKQALTVLQIFAISQFGCGGREFQRNLLKRTTKGNHWGDLRAKLEIAIDEVTRHAEQQEKYGMPLDSDYTSDSEDAPVIQCNQALVSAVRKDLAMALRDLLQHGLMEVGQSSSLIPFGCFPNRRRREEKTETKMMHAWDIFLKYYDMKHGKEYNETPARKLSDAFSLEMVGGKAITTKQTLLSAIHEVMETHIPLKRSEDSQLKAWVCIALNEKKLVNWLRLILRTSSLIEFYYQPWSYVVKTGFDDGLASLEKLGKFNFNLPVDMAVRPFNNIRDAF